MTRYETLKTKPKRFLSLTGYTLEEFSALLPYFSKRFLASVETKTLEGKPRKNDGILTIKIVACQTLKISCSLF